METKHCSCAALRGATRALSLAYDEALRPSGLRVSQFSILASVASAGEVSMSDLAEQITMDRTTLARNLKPLEREQFIQIAVGVDRRERIVSITANGRKTLERAIPLWHAVQTRFEAKVGKREAKRILELTRSLILVGRDLSSENAGMR